MDSAITKPAAHPGDRGVDGDFHVFRSARRRARLAGDHMESFDLQPGEILVRAGDPAEHLMVLFRGEMRAERADGRVYVMHAGQVTGLLPYSRLTHYPSTAHAAMESRGATLHKSHFAEMLQRMPVLNQRLVSVLADRIRETTVARSTAGKADGAGQDLGGSGA